MQHPERPEAQDDLDELGRARRRAFSREGTDADLELVRELEDRARRRSGEPSRQSVEDATDDAAGARAVADVEPSGVAETDSEDTPPPESADRATPPRRPTWLRPAALGLAGGLLIGAAGATLANPLVWAQTPASFTEQIAPDSAGSGSSLAIFDRTPSERDVLGAAALPQIFDPEAGTPEVRWLADVDGATVYVSRGERNGEPRICLVIVSAGSARGGCASEQNFASGGLGGTFGGLSIRWGPYGVAPWVPYEPDAR